MREECVQYFDVPGPPPTFVSQEQKWREEDPAQISDCEVLLVKSFTAYFDQGIQCSQFLFILLVWYFGLLEMKIVILLDNTYKNSCSEFFYIHKVMTHNNAKMESLILLYLFLHMKKLKQRS